MCCIKKSKGITLNHLLLFRERWLRGRRHVPAKDAYPSKGTVGSNPTLSVCVLYVR